MLVEGLLWTLKLAPSMWDAKHCHACVCGVSSAPGVRTCHLTRPCWWMQRSIEFAAVLLLNVLQLLRTVCGRSQGAADWVFQIGFVAVPDLVGAGSTLLCRLPLRHSNSRLVSRRHEAVRAQAPARTIHPSIRHAPTLRLVNDNLLRTPLATI